ncbi:hypothetical protein NMG60_11019133 [Bertholletia excelsa]
MFYSQCLLSRKGALGPIWVAAHCLKRLKKHQVAQTNISTSVDKILEEEVPVVAYRILAFLLLGVVRIYSKKVEYLFHDCQHALMEMNDFVRSKSKNTNVRFEAIRAPPPPISRPKRLELDAFDVQILESGGSGHVRPEEDTILEDAWKYGDIGHCSNNKYKSKEKASYLETCSKDYTRVEDVISPSQVENDTVASPSHNLSTSKASIEKLRDKNFSLEERLDPVLLDNLGEEPGFVTSCGDNHQNDTEQIKLLDIQKCIGVEEEPSDLVRSIDQEQDMNARQIKFPDMISPESGKGHITTRGSTLSITIDMNEAKLPNVSGSMPDYMVVRTPAAMERGRVSRKRKCLFDEAIVLPNKVLKESIANSRNLVCKRRKAPLTVLQAWTASQIHNLPPSFFEPLIPGISLELRSLFRGKKLKKSEALETVETPEELHVFGSPAVHKSPDQADIAPSTPVGRSASLRPCEIPEVSNLNGVGRASSFQSLEKSPSDDREFDLNLINEETNSCGDSQEINEWSNRTRTVARYLFRSFLNRKKQSEGWVVNLFQVLEGKTRSHSAKLFYEILVLKTGGYIDAKQNAPYDDILVLETPILKQFCES